MSSPQISVVVPVYNVEKYIAQCLDSIREQTFTDIEIICIDDGSTDNSLQILKEYAAIDQRIKILSQPNRGIAITRNVGINAVCGKYMIFIDSDDYIDKNTLLTMFTAIENNPVDFVISHYKCFSQTPEREEFCQTVQRWFDGALTSEGVYPCWGDTKCKISTSTSQLMRMDIIRKFNLSYPENLIHEDEYWAWAYRIHCQNYYYIPEPFYNYRIHGTSIRNTENSTPRPLDYIKIHHLIIQELKKFELLEKFLPTLEKQMNHQLTNTISFSGRHNYDDAKKLMAEYLKTPEISSEFKNNISAYLAADIPVSIIIPVYNCAPYLAKCLDSILAQTVDIFEVICIDDESTDNSLEILQKYAATDSRIRILPQKHVGVSAIRNIGLQAARGRYIYFADSDDFVEPQLIERTFLYIQNSLLDQVLFQTKFYNPQTQSYSSPSYYSLPNNLPYFSIQPVDKKLELMATLPQEVWNKMYCRQIIVDNNITLDEDLSLGEDELFNLQYLLHCKRCGILKESLYNYCYPREGSIMTEEKKNISSIKNMFPLLNKLHQMIKQQSSKEMAKALSKRYMIHINETLKNYPVFSNRECYNQMRQLLKKHKTVLHYYKRKNGDIHLIKKVKLIIRLNYFFFKIKQFSKALFHPFSTKKY